MGPIGVVGTVIPPPCARREGHAEEPGGADRRAGQTARCAREREETAEGEKRSGRKRAPYRTRAGTSAPPETSGRTEKRAGYSTMALQKLSVTLLYQRATQLYILRGAVSEGICSDHALHHPISPIMLRPWFIGCWQCSHCSPKGVELSSAVVALI